VFRRFLCVFAQKEHPLTLFFDDLQWLDVATLNFIEHLLSHPDVKHLLIVGAYRNNEVSPSHPLMLTLNSIRKAGVTVDEIVLQPLSLKDVEQFLGDALRRERARSTELAQLACSLIERYGFNTYKTKAYFCMQRAMLWNQPIGSAIDSIRLAIDAGGESHDVVFASFS
jgi:hypothetical protein